MTQKSLISITGRLQRLLVSFSAYVLLIAGLMILVFELSHQRHILHSQAQTFAVLIAPELASELIADASVASGPLLQDYLSEADLLGLYVYRKDGSEYARSVKPEFAQALPTPSFKLRAQLNEAHQISLDLFEYSLPIRHNNRLVGQLYLQYGLATIERQMLLYFVSVVLIYALLLLGMYLLSRRILRRFAEPVGQILTVIDTVRTTKNFSLSVPENDQYCELNRLSSDLNWVLQQANKSTLALQAHQQEIEQHIYFDPLTGLVNRRMLIQRIEREVVRAKRTGQIGALVYLDLDHFKAINDSLGHNVGDAVLKSVALRISKAVREADTPARLGGDEFVVLLPELGKSESSAAHNALNIAEKIRQAISTVHQLDERDLHVTPSIGIALFDGEKSDLENLLMQADLAMYQAKEDGRNRVQFFLKQMQEHTDHRRQIEESLRQAIANDKLYVCYQPLVRSDGAVVGAEALVRWEDEEEGLISPSAFIPIAEMTDLICYLGQWVLTDVCKQMAAWEDQGKNLVVSVNISPREFQQTDFVEQVQEIVLTTGVKAEHLVLELTEGILLNNIEAVSGKMQRLSQLGIRFSLDDFGKGYSSLQYLKQLPLSALKIDQSFVRSITTDSNDAEIVATIIAMAQTLGIEVIAEGVENREELECLKHWGCQLFQGFYFSRAVRAKRIHRLIRRTGKHSLQPAPIASLMKHQFSK